MSAFDPRVTPVRPDLAAKHLEGRVDAARFVEGELLEVIAAQAPVRRTPSHEASLETEALKGEGFVAYDADSEGWTWASFPATAMSDGFLRPHWASRAGRRPIGFMRCALSRFPARR